MPYLQPDLIGDNISVDYMLKYPTRLKARIARLADAELLLPVFAHQLGAPVIGGGMIYSTITRDNYFATRDVEQRGPGDEYPRTSSLPPTPHVANLEDWGAVFEITDEKRMRNDIALFDQEVTSLSNTLARKVDELLMREVEKTVAASGGARIIPGHDWSDLQLFGPEATLTPSHSLPTADIAGARLAAAHEELGVEIDTFVVNPQERFNLEVAYAERLDSMLKSAGISLVSNPRVEPGVAWAIQKGRPATIGFEIGLTVRPIPVPERRTTIVQAFVVPAIGITEPAAMFKITGLAG